MGSSLFVWSIRRRYYRNEMERRRSIPVISYTTHARTFPAMTEWENVEEERKSLPGTLTILPRIPSFPAQCAAQLGAVGRSVGPPRSVIPIHPPSLSCSHFLGERRRERRRERSFGNVRR